MADPKMYARCNIGKGMFSDEYYMEIFDVNKRKNWGFVDKSNIKTKVEPDEGLVEGLVRVLQIIKRDEDRCLIELSTYDIDRVYISSENLEIFV